MRHDQHLTDTQVIAAFQQRVAERQAIRQRETRLAAARAAKASVSLEGFSLTPEYETMVQRYVEDEITFDQLLAFAKKGQTVPASIA